VQVRAGARAAGGKRQASCDPAQLPQCACELDCANALADRPCTSQHAAHQFWPQVAPLLAAGLLIPDPVTPDPGVCGFNWEIDGCFHRMWLRPSKASRNPEAGFKERAWHPTASLLAWGRLRSRCSVVVGTIPSGRSLPAAGRPRRRFKCESHALTWGAHGWQCRPRTGARGWRSRHDGCAYLAPYSGICKRGAPRSRLAAGRVWATAGVPRQATRAGGAARRGAARRARLEVSSSGNAALPGGSGGARSLPGSSLRPGRWKCQPVTVFAMALCWATPTFGIGHLDSRLAALARAQRVFCRLAWARFSPLPPPCGA
jgi:hypothetical protein